MAVTKTTKKGNGRDKTAAVRLFETRNDLKPETRQAMILLLNEQLADTFDLYSITKEAHWNVKGPEFYQLHELYDEFAAKLLEFGDVIAERATALGGLAQGTVRRAAGATRLEEYPLETVASLETVRALAERYAALAATTREAVDRAEEQKDMGTSDLFIDVSRELDKMLWFLEAHLQAGEDR